MLRKKSPRKKVAKKVAKKKVAKKVAKKKVTKKKTSGLSKIANTVKKVVDKMTDKKSSKSTAKKSTKTSGKKTTSSKAAEPTKSQEITKAQAKVQDEIAGLSESFSWEDIAEAIGTLDFFVDQRSDDCGQKGCDNLRTTQQYCRLHYIANWNDIKRKREILREGKLQQYIEELISKYPPAYIKAVAADLQDEKDFYRALSELNIATDVEFEEDFEGQSESEIDSEDIDADTRNYTSVNRFERED